MIDWTRFPQLAQQAEAQRWLQFQVQLGRADNTVLAYARAMEDYFRMCDVSKVDPRQATREHIALFIQEMLTRKRADGGQGLANATVHQRLTGVRLCTTITWLKKDCGSATRLDEAVMFPVERI